jgi:hypothetical protein
MVIWSEELRGPDSTANPDVIRKFDRQRITICMSCDRFSKYTRLCKECGCFMPAKTKLRGSFCPIGKWGKEDG